MKAQKYNGYPSYKQSGADWLGEIPIHWDVLPTKRFFRLVAEPAEVNNDYELLSVYTEIGVRPRKELEQKGNKASTTDGYWLVKKGDLIVNKLLAWMGAVGHSDYEGVTSPAYDILRKTKDFNPRYYHYLFRNEIAQNEFKRWSRGIMEMRLRLYFEELGRILMPFPSKEEIDQIAKFLDHETEKIDLLIKKQQELIALLKEKRQAVISHAVTKGLNPDVPMKDSGVEWLGDVPEHWELKNYRYATRIYRGKFGHRPRNDPSLYDGEFPFIQTGDIARAGKNITSYSQTLNRKGAGVSEKFPSGTLVMAIAANIGDTAILDFEAFAPDSVVGFKPNENISLDFLRLSLKAALPALEKTSTQSTQANLNIERIGSVKGAFPPLNEQESICAHIDRLLVKYEDLQIICESQITFLQERRTALISAAVTGKIDVRDWKAPD